MVKGERIIFRRLKKEDIRPRKAHWLEGEYADLVNMSLLRDDWWDQ